MDLLCDQKDHLAHLTWREAAASDKSQSKIIILHAQHGMLLSKRWRHFPGMPYEVVSTVDPNPGSGTRDRQHDDNNQVVRGESLIRVHNGSSSRISGLQPWRALIPNVQVKPSATSVAIASKLRSSVGLFTPGVVRRDAEEGGVTIHHDPYIHAV